MFLLRFYDIIIIFSLDYEKELLAGVFFLIINKWEFHTSVFHIDKSYLHVQHWKITTIFDVLHCILVL
jgi:hypothetical protein